MGRVLVTGGSGFIAAHIINVLIKHGHSIVTTVRSRSKGQRVVLAHNRSPEEMLSYVIVPDIAKEGAFDEVVQSDPPFDCVIHTASPFHDNFDDPRDILDPAIQGTTNILHAIKKYAPQVKRVVVTSSFAAIVNTACHPKVYDETSWNPITWDQAVNDRRLAYRGSKALAERAAWDFIEKEKPNFDLVTMNPPLVYGPVIHHIDNLYNLNTSNAKIRDFLQGDFDNDQLPPTGTFLFVDVRDLALAHVRAIEVPEAGGKRFFIVGGHCSNKRILDIIRVGASWELHRRLPRDPTDDFPANVYGYDNSRARELLGIEFRSLRDCINDTTSSIYELERETGPMRNLMR